MANATISPFVVKVNSRHVVPSLEIAGRIGPNFRLNDALPEPYCAFFALYGKCAIQAGLACERGHQYECE